MKIAILQPTPFRKGHYFIYTKSLFDKIYSYGKKVKIISALKTYDVLKNEKPSKLNFNIYSFHGLILYLALCIATISRFIILRKNFNRIIILDCEYTCISILLFILRLLRWEGKITIQVNAPNFNYNIKKEGFRPFGILKFLQSLIFRKSLYLFDLKISCIGIWHKRELSKQLSFPSNKILVIEDGGGEVIKKVTKSSLIIKLKENCIVFPKKNKKIFLLFGNFRKDKGYLFISSVWNKFFNHPNDPYLWIVGHDEEKILGNINSARSSNIVIHNYYVPLEIISYIYQKSDFAILPYMSNYRGGSGPLMKGAFTHEKLAIVANVSEMGRLAKEENLAEYFEAEDESSLLSCINKILKRKPDFYKEQIMKARNYTNQRDWSSLSSKFIDSLE